MTVAPAICLVLTALVSLSWGSPEPFFLDPPSLSSSSFQVDPFSTPSLYGRRTAAFSQAVALIKDEKFNDALLFIQKQPHDLRSWSGLSVLEAGLLSVSRPREALELYERVLNGQQRDKNYARALAGYRMLLKSLSDGGDYGARARLIRCLTLEWRNAEALALIDRSLAETQSIPDTVRVALENQIPVLALRVGDFARAAELWEKKNDTVSLRWLSTLRIRQGRFEEAAEARLKAAKGLKGRKRHREMVRVFEIMTKGGLTDRAVKFMEQVPDFEKSCPDYNFQLGLSALSEADYARANDYFRAQEERGGDRQKSGYFRARALEMSGDTEQAKALFKTVSDGPSSYYRILAEGRVLALSGEGSSGATAEPMARLLDGFGRDIDALGFYEWLVERVPWPWPSEETGTTRYGPGEAARSRAAIDYYLANGDSVTALLELSSAASLLLPARAVPLNQELARYILLAARGGDYRLAVRLMASVKSPENNDSKKWSHPLALSHSVLGAWRRYGLPPQVILALIRTESAFQADVVSASNARGLMQILPSTATCIARILGEPEPREEDLFNPDLNIRYGSWYLAELQKAFGHLALALAAYNGGPFNIKSFMENRSGLPLDLFIEILPLSESSAYVKRVLESVYIYESSYLGRAKALDLTVILGGLPGDPPPF